MLRLYAPRDVEALLERTGFRWERLGGYDTFAFLAGWYGYAATRPA